jgi:cullin-4
MIDQTLKLKRFADRSVSSLFPSESSDNDEEERNGDDEEQDDPMEGRLDRAQRKSELEDAIRKGCRAGMGSRENAPAEWIGESLSAIRGLNLLLSDFSQTPGRCYEKRSRQGYGSRV